MSSIDVFETVGIVPVIKVHSVSRALQLAELLKENLIPVMEITYRTSSAPEVINAIHERFPDIILGAGTVTTITEVDSAISHGATFLVSPGFNPTIAEYCIAKGYDYIPGVTSPSEIEQAASLGLKILKFFPAELSGGVKMLKAFASVYPSIRFMPTGGINEQNITSYLALDNVIACGGTWIVPTVKVEAGLFEEIGQLLRSCINRLLGLKIAHTGLCVGDRENTVSIGGVFEGLLGVAAKEGGSSLFLESSVELVYRDKEVPEFHIGIWTESISRALHFLQSVGVAPIEGTKKYSDGKLKAVYFTCPGISFPIHLVQ